MAVVSSSPVGGGRRRESGCGIVGPAIATAALGVVEVEILLEGILLATSNNEAHSLKDCR